ncbi:hypothetical protein G6F37_004054 [Rhizopus arrhizus]|nr:hypothetical protein G6F38_004194 [Rhizopus arrhizus]KAG1160365.1 hypothetical protein G6F37_004054 [Rhizopus arrhizus]
MTCKTSSSNKVPRPMNSFMIYRLEKQQEIVKECPGANHRDISKVIAKWWKEMADEEKEHYRQKAELARQEHHRLYPNYKYSPKKKVKNTRAYKKRPKNEFTAVDYENRRRLIAIYRRGNNECSEQNNNFDWFEEKSSPYDPYLSSYSQYSSASTPILPSCQYPEDILFKHQPSSLMLPSSENKAYYLSPQAFSCSESLGYNTYASSSAYSIPHEIISSQQQNIYAHESNNCYPQHADYLHSRWDSLEPKNIQETYAQPIHPFFMYPFY